MLTRKLAAIESAYSHVEEHAAETSAATSRKKGGGPLDVVAVEAYISERFLTRKNGVRGYVEVASKKKRNGQKPVFKPVTDYWVNSLWLAGFGPDVAGPIIPDYTHPSGNFHPLRIRESLSQKTAFLAEQTVPFPT